MPYYPAPVSSPTTLEPDADHCPQADALDEEPAVRERQLGGKLANRSLGAQVFLLAVWPFLEQLLGFLVGTVDLALAGRLSDQPNDPTVTAGLNALGIATYLQWLVGLTLGSVGTGATALIARATGAKHKRLANAALGQAMVLSTGVGVLLTAGLWVGAPALAALFLPGELDRQLCVEYLRVWAFASPFAAWLFIGSACLRGAGDTRTPFFAMTAVNVVNIATSVWFVSMGLGIAGIAAGTLVAWVVGALINVTVLSASWTSAPIRLRLIRMRPHAHTMRRIVKVAWPAFVERSGMWMINAAVVTFVAALAAKAAVGAHIIAIRIEAVSFLPGFALAAAAATLTGQYLGLGAPKRAQRAAELCAFTAMTTMTLMGLVFMLLPVQLVKLVAPNSPEVWALAAPALVICGAIQPFFAAYMVFGDAMRGAGDTRSPMVLSWSSLLTVRLVGAYVLGVHLGFGLTGIWFALCADLMVKGVLFTARFLQGKWKHTAV